MAEPLQCSLNFSVSRSTAASLRWHLLFHSAICPMLLSSSSISSVAHTVSPFNGHDGHDVERRTPVASSVPHPGGALWRDLALGDHRQVTTDRCSVIGLRRCLVLQLAILALYGHNSSHWLLDAVAEFLPYITSLHSNNSRGLPCSCLPVDVVYRGSCHLPTNMLITYWADSFPAVAGLPPIGFFPPIFRRSVQIYNTNAPVMVTSFQIWSAKPQNFS